MAVATLAEIAGIPIDPPRIVERRIVQCSHPEAAGCRGRILLEAYETDEGPQNVFILRCDQCSRRMVELPGFPVELYIDRASDNPTEESIGMLRRMCGAHSEAGYLCGGYLLWAGMSHESLMDAQRGVVRYCCGDVALSPMSFREVAHVR